MSNSANEQSVIQQRFAEVFTQLPEQDIEQFYAHYQLWVLRHRAPIIKQQIEILQEHVAENQKLVTNLHPSAIALAVLARLQSNGVNNIDLLDQMLERGEDWLDRMMQRLDYCEQVEDFIQGDYTQWCIRSLEGAYDWIDSLLGSIQEGSAFPATADTDTQATEELLLQKLSLDDEEAMLEVTSRRPAARVENEIEHSMPVNAEEHITEPQESADEVETPQEMADWQNLEDLEATGERSAPWYSVNLDANASANSDQPACMDDWIQVLQADTASRIESTSESVIESAMPANQPAESVLETEVADAQLSAVSQPENEATPASLTAEANTTSETQNELEIISSTQVEEAQEQNTASTAVATLVEIQDERAEETGTTPSEMATENEPVIEESAAPSEEVVENQSAEEGTTPGEEVVESPASEEERATEEESTSHAQEEEPIETETGTEHIQEIEETPLTAEEPTEILDPQNPTAEATPLETKVTDVGEQADLTDNGIVTPAEPGEVPETANYKPDAGQEETEVNEIEAAVMANDSLSTEDEQLAWYEYLEMDGLENHAPHPPGKTGERVEIEETLTAIAANSPANQADTPELYEYVLPAESSEGVKRQADQTPRQESTTTEETFEIEGWQMWEANTDDEKTQPIAREKILTVPETPHLGEPEHTSNVFQETPILGRSETISSPTERPEVVEEPLIEAKIEESVTGPREHQTDDLAQRETVPAQPAQQSTEPPKKLSFWQRLFRRWRKK